VTLCPPSMVRGSSSRYGLLLFVVPCMILLGRQLPVVLHMEHSRNDASGAKGTSHQRGGVNVGEAWQSSRERRGTCVRVLVGIFGKSGEPEREGRFRRWLPMLEMRAHGHSELQCGLNVVFVHGKDLLGDLLRRREPDTIVLDILENMNKGKTWAWFQRGAEFRGADYIFKMDQDTGICPNELLKILQVASTRRAEYIGWKHSHATCGGTPHCPPLHMNESSAWAYMSGAFYGMSAELATRLGRSIQVRQTTTVNGIAHDALRGNTWGYEDMVIGKMIYSLGEPRVFDIACIYDRSGLATAGYSIPGCPVQHFQSNKEFPSFEPVCSACSAHGSCPTGTFCASNGQCRRCAECQHRSSGTTTCGDHCAAPRRATATVVTAFYMASARHSTHGYKQRIQNFLRTGSPMVIFCDKESLPLLQELRPLKLRGLTRFIAKELGALKWARNFVDVFRTSAHQNTMDSYQFNNSKPEFVAEVSETNPFGTDTFWWMDIDSLLGRRFFSKQWPAPEMLARLPRGKIVISHVKDEDVTIGMGGTAAAVRWFSSTFYAELNRRAHSDVFVGKDQTSYTHVYNQHPGKFAMFSAWKHTGKCDDFWDWMSSEVDRLIHGCAARARCLRCRGMQTIALRGGKPLAVRGAELASAP